MFGRLNLLCSDMPEQIDRPPHAQIAPIAGHDEIVTRTARGARSHEPANLIEACPRVDLHRRTIHHAGDGFTVVHLRMERSAQENQEVVPMHHPDGATVLDNREGRPRGLLPEYLY